MNNKKTVVKALLFLFSIIGIGILIALFSDKFALNEGWIDQNVRNNGFNGIFYFVVLSALTMACGLPRQLSAFFGGYAFGLVGGTLLSCLAATLGCVISFYFARLLAKPYVTHKFPSKVLKVNRFFSQNVFTKTIIVRLLPVGSNLVMNLVAGVTQIKALDFIAGSAVGYVPQMAIFALAGSGVTVLSIWKIILSVALLLISTLLSIHLYRRQYSSNISFVEN